MARLWTQLSSHLKWICRWLSIFIETGWIIVSCQNKKTFDHNSFIFQVESQGGITEVEVYTLDIPSACFFNYFFTASEVFQVPGEKTENRFYSFGWSSPSLSHGVEICTTCRYSGLLDFCGFLFCSVRNPFKSHNQRCKIGHRIRTKSSQIL